MEMTTKIIDNACFFVGFSAIMVGFIWLFMIFIPDAIRRWRTERFHTQLWDDPALLNLRAEVFQLQQQIYKLEIRK